MPSAHWTCDRSAAGASGRCQNWRVECYAASAWDSSCRNTSVPIAIGAVAVVLVLGLINMMRGGSPNTSQKLMRLRVLLQFVAIIVIMATIWVMGR